jgi:UDP-GlcNAc3NAcA epimerase
MKPLKIITIIGARPQFIKAAVISNEISGRAMLNETIIHTGQHFDKNMSDVFFKQMQIPKPKYHLNINSLNHGAMTGQMLEKIENVLTEEKPDIVIVYGDTNSTLAGALAAKKLDIKVAHIEAGLRSFNMKMPEEINRIVTDRISDFLFCPTKIAVKNLKNEGFENFNCSIINSGDVMYDAVLHFSELESDPGIEGIEDFVLVTVHRQENTDDIHKLRSIFSALNSISKKTKIIIPVHPRTRKIIESKLESMISNDITLIEPVGYLEMLYLLKRCKLVMTDSGGVQKEAFFFGKYCITLREETEWVELVEGGYNKLAGFSEDRILDEFNSSFFKEFKSNNSLYGNGNASSVIINTIEEIFE